MNHDEILQGLYDQTLVGNAPAVLDLTNEGLATGLTPERMLFEALIPSLEEVGARFERGDFFVPEMLIAGKAMSGALDLLRPLLAETGAETVGKFVMGTVKGDVHDIGKNLVNIMLEGAGFEVIDLGVQVAPEKFIAAIEEHKPDIVGFSAFLTTTMPMFKANINALAEGRPAREGDRDGRRRAGHAGVRGRGRRRRLCGRRLGSGQAREVADQGATRDGAGLAREARSHSQSTRSRSPSSAARCAARACCTRRA